MKILEFDTQEEAENALDAVNEIVLNWFADHGFTVDEDGVVGKNAATGQDAPLACRTTTWANIQESPDSTFYFASPSDDARFTGWRDYIPEGATMPDDKDMPDDWQT